MLDTMRKSASGIVGIFLIGLLVVAFALWGIADTFTGFSTSVLAKVGDQEIEREEFAARYRQRVQIVQQELGSQLTPEQASAMGISQQVIRSMVGTAALSGVAKDLDLAISDDALVEMILQDPAFAGLSGQFDEPTFRMVLRRNGLNEDLFVNDQRDFHVREQLMAATFDRAMVPEIMQSQLFAHFLERRTAKYAILSLGATEEVGEPTEEELEAFYNATQLRFTEQERRSAVVLSVTPERFAESITFTQDDLREEYDIAIADYTVVEERGVDQLVLSDEATVELVRDLLASGTPFVEVVDAAGQNLDNTDLGTITRDDMISSVLADAAFSLNEGEVSGIVEGPLGSVVLRVRNIKPEVVTPFEDVADDIRQRLVTDRAIDDLLAFSETIEDERAAGSSLEEIAQRFDLELTTVENFDRDGKAEDGARAPALSRLDSLVEVLFDSIVGEDLPLLETEDGSFAWARLTGIQPSRVRPLDDVRAQATAQWKVSERANLLEALAAHLVKQGNETGDFDKIAKQMELITLTSEPMTRQVSNETFSEQAVAKLFATEEGKFAWAPVGFGSELVVMQAVEVTRAKANENSEAKDLIFSGERRKYHADITDQFVRSLQASYGIEIYQDNIDLAVSQLVGQ